MVVLSRSGGRDTNQPRKYTVSFQHAAACAAAQPTRHTHEPAAAVHTNDGQLLGAGATSRRGAGQCPYNDTDLRHEQFRPDAHTATARWQWSARAYASLAPRYARHHCQRHSPRLYHAGDSPATVNAP